MASGRSGDQGAFEEEAEADGRACSLDVDLRSPWPKLIPRGLRGNDDLLWLDEDGELDSLRFSALLKLHFFDGVLETINKNSTMYTVG